MIGFLAPYETDITLYVLVPAMLLLFIHDTVVLAFSLKSYGVLRGEIGSTDLPEY